METRVNLRTTLRSALEANQAGSGVDHILIALPSFSMGESLLAHYAERVASLEHRYLVSMLSLARITNCQLVFVCSLAPSADVVSYYVSLMPAESRASVVERFRVLEVPDRSSRAIAAKLLNRPDLIDGLRAVVGGRPALIEPWNVTADEVRLAELLGVPINGTPPELWHLGFKSAGRQLMAKCGVPIPVGREDLISVDDVVTAVEDLRRVRPLSAGVVIKTDDSGAGDGNRVIHFDAVPDLRRHLEQLPDWYLADVSKGAIVEELIGGEHFSSPSVQLDIAPGQRARVLSTHEQVLGGPDGQVYLGCRFPADAAYAAQIGELACLVGDALADQGALGRVGVDFAASRGGDGPWSVYGLEINLRKGGTTHPYTALRNVVPGHYDVARAEWVAEDGSTRCYQATDNLVDPAWTGRPAGEVIGAVRDAGLEFDPGSGTGVILHMLSGLAIDGRLGLTAIGTSAEHAAQLFDGCSAALATK